MCCDGWDFKVFLVDVFFVLIIFCIGVEFFGKLGNFLVILIIDLELFVNNDRFFFDLIWLRFLSLLIFCSCVDLSELCKEVFKLFINFVECFFVLFVFSVFCVIFIFLVIELLFKMVVKIVGGVNVVILLFMGLFCFFFMWFFILKLKYMVYFLWVLRYKFWIE